MQRVKAVEASSSTKYIKLQAVQCATVDPQTKHDVALRQISNATRKVSRFESDISCVGEIMAVSDDVVRSGYDVLVERTCVGVDRTHELLSADVGTAKLSTNESIEAEVASQYDGFSPRTLDCCSSG